MSGSQSHWFFARRAATGLLCIFLGSCSPSETHTRIAQLKCFPPSINLGGAKSRQSIVVQAIYIDGITRDVTYDARCRVANGSLASFDGTAISPRADGRTDLLVTYAGRTLAVPITVSNATVAAPISFKLDVMPVF